MIFYGTYRTFPGLRETPLIDYMEFEFKNSFLLSAFIPDDIRDAPDVELPVDWDESDWMYDPDSGICEFRCKGISINDMDANGTLDLFKNATLTEMQVGSAELAFLPAPAFELTTLTIQDGSRQLKIAGRKLRGAYVCAE